MKVAAVVILYKPDAQVIPNIQSFEPYVDVLYVYDNTGSRTPTFNVSELPAKARYINDGSNEGIAKRINMAAETARAEGFEWLLTMDQDTFFSQESITYYMNCFQNYAGKEQVAVFGTAYGREPKASEPTCAPQPVEVIITSASLINLALLPVIGRFDENLFIDLVDYDYCLRAAAQHYAIIQFNNIHVVHHIGTMVNRASIKTLYLVKKRKQIHTPLRCYYMYRNMLYIEQKFAGINPGYAARIRAFVTDYVKTNMLYGRNSRQLKQYIQEAKADFASNRMGKKAQA
ncbi:rhamnosyltransferase [Filimonas lacunae]|uniref:Rhamnosyltransferase n=1 Tax=Filimonas lacunae TaxID=477680 RepID=A0A173MQA1_9BACT|nr:glycosyltransferase [Filimonas lacunae]BAV09824.1 dTDP-rhamnosyl transferase RfbF [Filimonas lacunae]SIS79503.1 rhamnosyltransferase [Filimonas lacunae]